MESITDLVSAVGNWAALNFKAENPWRGMVEEVGETAHCLLKRLQGIRGFENPDFFKEQFADSIGDVGIYAAHYAHVNGLQLHFIPAAVLDTPTDSEEAVDTFLAYALRRLAQLHLPAYPGTRQADFEEFIGYVAALAEVEGVDMQAAVFATWQRIVSKRDWRTNPASGTDVAMHN